MVVLYHEISNAVMIHSLIAIVYARDNNDR